MKEKVYIETSVISYLCSRPSRDLVVAANQEVTREWWNGARSHYDCFVSELLLEEAGEGDPEAAAKRLGLANELAILPVNDRVKEVAREILSRTGFPEGVADDITHIAITAVYGIDYLLTWNCAHIANPHWLPRLVTALSELGYEAPVMCTPQALLEGEV
ncbi:MAG: type II toxin-antitoxin system VapC family toxin [Lentisphaerae bacterium]|nr:type II toxin-antitoxin system VapC family toxin [Lentisphaerota bacterium]